MSQKDKLYLFEHADILADTVQHLLMAHSILSNRREMINNAEAAALKDFEAIKEHFEELLLITKEKLFNYRQAHAEQENQMHENIKNHESKSRQNAEEIFLKMCGRSVSVIKYDELKIEAPKQKVKWKNNGPLNVCGEFTEKELRAIADWLLFAPREFSKI